jgi:hypothetical protein
MPFDKVRLMAYSTKITATVAGLSELTWLIAISARCPACGATAEVGETDQRATVTCQSCVCSGPVL